MNDINNSILTLILLVPLGGAVLVALAPDRAKLPNWLALLTALSLSSTSLGSRARRLLIMSASTVSASG
jgi:NADH:ubiquinone oxidoreductase subunit 4 (subunit M)